MYLQSSITMYHEELPTRNNSRISVAENSDIIKEYTKGMFNISKEIREA